MKSYKYFFIVLLIFNNVTMAQWFQQNSGTTTGLNSVFFIDSLKGWIVGKDSTILHTSNSGIDWIAQTSGFSGYENNYNDVFFANETLGWVVGGTDFDGIILHTSDGGNSWVKQSEGMTRRLSTVYFINDSVGWVGGGPEYPGGKIILKTTNSGLVWDTLLFETYPNSIFDIKFINENTGWAVGGVYPGWGNIIMKTIDGGNNWIYQLENYYYNPIASCDFISEQVGWVTFAGGISDPVGIMNTMDGGITWNMQYIANPSSFESINSIIFVNDHKGWTAGSLYWNPPESRILHTYDGGLNWEAQSVTASAALNSIFFINEYNGWAVGDGGTILHTTNGGVPVELTSFTAIANGREVVLNWSTATETNNQGFEILRFTQNDDDGWNNIGFVPGYGTTTETQHYSFTDNDVSAGKYQYRLKQIDYDGSYEYSQIIDAIVDAPTKFSLEQNYPNPFNPTTKIKYRIPSVIASEAKQSQLVILKVFDILGNEIETLVNKELPAGEYEVEFLPESSIKHPASSVYFYQLRAGSFIQTRKMVYLK